MKEISRYPALPTLFPRPADYLPRAAASQPTSGQPVAESTPSSPPTGGTNQAVAESHETERLHLIGRAGRNPALTARDDPKKSKATFPLAVRENADKPTWHTVVAFGDRAHHVMDTVRQGNTYEVIGYHHESAYTGRDGTPRVKREVYAARVIPR